MSSEDDGGPSAHPKQPGGQQDSKMTQEERKKLHRARLKQRRGNRSIAHGSTADFAFVTGMTEEQADQFEREAAKRGRDNYRKNPSPIHEVEEADRDERAAKAMVSEARKATAERHKMEASLASELRTIEAEKLAKLAAANKDLGSHLGRLEKGASSPVMGGGGTGHKKGY